MKGGFSAAQWHNLTKSLFRSDIYWCHKLEDLCVRRSAAQPHPTVVALCTGQPHSRYNRGGNPPVDSQPGSSNGNSNSSLRYVAMSNFLPPPPFFVFGILQHSGTQCECVSHSSPIRRSCLSLSFALSLSPLRVLVLTNRRTQQRVNLFKLTTCKVYLHASCATPPSTPNSPYLPPC